MNLERARGFRSVVLTVLVAFATLAPACLNDRDTLADEAKKNRDVLTTLVGGFERNPPLYYQMRIKRIEGELKANPKLIDEYDDIAVANDRIGNDDDAIKWIEAKRAQLAPLDLKSETSKDEWYRYYANCGTFWVHRWAKNGASAGRIKEVEHGRDLIRQALGINPNAHFGREKYQEMVMNWLIDANKGDLKDAVTGKGGKPLGDYVSMALDRQGGGFEDKEKEAIVGLTGLIRLGGAWQSPDVYWAIGSLYRYPEQAMTHIANLRAKEIIDAGGHSLDPSYIDIDHEATFAQGPPLDQQEIAEYWRLRRRADKWNAERQAFMIVRLKAGRHPDTDPHFWDGSPAMPEFTVRQNFSSWWDRDVMSVSHRLAVISFFVLCVPVVIVVLVVRKAFKSRREAQQPLS